MEKDISGMLKGKHVDSHTISTAGFHGQAMLHSPYYWKD